MDAIILELLDTLITLPAAGVHNAYNAAATMAAAHALGIPPGRVAAALDEYEPRFGRCEHLSVDGRPVVLELMKNAAGAGVLVREVVSDQSVGAVVVAVSDQAADGRDISWIWDADFEQLVDRRFPLIPAGRRAADTGVRLKYAGAEPAAPQTEPLAAIRCGLALCPPRRRLVVLATYSAMLDIRSALLSGRRDSALKAS